MRVAIVGGGIAGMAIARDVALRGLECVVIERGIVGRGKSTRCAWMLHSGARYAIRSPALARMCADASHLLRDLASFAISDAPAFFICLDIDPPDIEQAFLSGCSDAGITVEPVSVDLLLRREPEVTDRIRSAFTTPDRSIDPVMLTEGLREDISRLGVDVLERHEIVGATDVGGKRRQLRIHNLTTHTDDLIPVDYVVNAAGPDAFSVAGVFGIALDVEYCSGSMAVLADPVLRSLIARCQPSAMVDTIIPAGDACLIGSTAEEVVRVRPDTRAVDDRHRIATQARLLVPGIRARSITGMYGGIRVAPTGRHACGRTVSEMTVIDHENSDGITGIVTALPGKLTLHRELAERVGDVVCNHLGVTRECRTRDRPLRPPENPRRPGLTDLTPLDA